jgi:serine palmitoyltransferase
MLFPAVYELGFHFGKTAHKLYHHTQPLPNAEEIVELIASSPWMYKDWWLNLVKDDPLHVLVETTLLVSIIYMVVSRTNEGYKHPSEKLTEAEQDQLLTEWKSVERAPLTPASTNANISISTNISTNTSTSTSTNINTFNDIVVVHKQHGRFMHVQIGDSDKLLKLLNFATFDFLGMQTNKDNKLKQVSEEALKKYGCGSCGPRGFYGTIDTHLQLEQEISKFTNTENAIMYSDGASTCSSTVAAFAKRGDLLVVDEGVYEPLLTGVMLSRANVKWFKHNDPVDLERVLQEVQKTNQTLGRKPNAQRRFIVVEGLYKNFGTICPLDKVVALKHKYHYRLILDESFSFGSLGPNGKGAMDLYGLQHMHDAEIVTIALENALGSVGGVTVGNEEVVDHQRLSGAGYCFSASVPPFTASAAIQALLSIKEQPELITTLHSNIQYMYQQLAEELPKTSILCVTSDERSPIVVLQLNQERPQEQELLRDVAKECMRLGVAVVATGKDSTGQLRTELAPAIRLTVSSLHTTEDMDTAVKTLVESASAVAKLYPLKTSLKKS